MNHQTSAAAKVERVVQAFLTPRRPPSPLPLAMPGGESQRIVTPDGAVALQRAGSGPGVLLVHGWEGQASDFAAFVPKLLESGYEVIVVHLPAHGNSTGEQTSIPHAARALRFVFQGLAPLHAAVAHSIGAAVLVEAMHKGLAVNRAVLISAPAYYEKYARGVAAACGLDADETAQMLGQLSAHIGIDIREVSLPARAPQMQQPALFIHSGDDRVVAIEDSLAGAAAWPGASHMRLDGLGHKRILTDSAVLAAALDFITPSA